MKKSVVVIISVILLFSLVIGQENVSEEKNVSGSLRKISERLNTSNIKESQVNIILPDYIQNPTRFIFKIESDEEIGIEYFMILVAVFLILLAIISGTIYMTPLHRKPIELFIFDFNTDYIIGGIVTLLVALTGVIDMVVSDWFFSLKLYEDLVSRMGWGVIFLIIFIFIVLFLVIRMLFGMLRKKLKIGEAEVMKENIGMMKDMAETSAESVEKMAESSGGRF